MASTTDYAVLSVAAYISSKSTLNQIPAPTGWERLPGELGYKLGTSGFEVAAYRNSLTNEIVIH